MYYCLYRFFPKLKALLNYFKEIANIANKLDLTIPWHLPSGLIVKQKYFEKKEVKFRPFIYTKDLLTLNIFDKKKFNRRKQTRALMPNLIHSLDAVSLALLIDKFFNENDKSNFYAVHDCFAITCNNVLTISTFLNLTYCSIYITNRFLLKFDEDFKNLIKILLGEHCIMKKNNKTIIQVINNNDKMIELNYPDINLVFKPDLDPEKFLESSYIIN